MTEMEKQLLKAAGMTEADTKPKDNDERIADLEDALAILADMVLGGVGDD